MSDGLASVYGVLPPPHPIDGIWFIHKHTVTGELLGPSVPFSVPTRCVLAIQGADGWEEITQPPPTPKGDRQ